MIYLLLAVAAIGHVIFWAAIVNRLHGLGFERRWVDGATIACAAAMAGAPVAVAGSLWLKAQYGIKLPADAGWVYVYCAAVFAVFSLFHRLWIVLHPERHGVVDSNHTTNVDMGKYDREQLTAPGIPTLLTRIPGNQVLDLLVHEKQISLPRMPSGRQLRIVHITDLHMSGRIAKEYFIAMAAAVNALEPDLIMLTGDLVERDKCMDWLPDTLGSLRAAAGIYYVLGNHDLRVDHRRLVRELNDLGLIHVGDTWRETTVRDTPIVIAGNELPWFGPAPNPAEFPRRDASGLPLRILLAHAPDRFAWACRHDFDLILAGHNHGGQVRLPMLGAILAPSVTGTRYASGAFCRGNSVLHVSRGTGSLAPIRWRCPPEIALLVLGAAN
jgi:uncharacterized protein